ncbi:ABC transporter ATP-binding protein [Paenibacillus sp. HB172176]|uniref:ABC transporter ATP-binding protein n=1 Tax=Paenibacillus sp. HB172176 TaxID=2493690 RepID=UPI00143A08E7|nr:ABC transporter ATP-binding protein [Paenibacillus sp. HB172176]
MSEPCLKLEKVGKVMKKQVVIDGLDFQVEQGEIVALLGGNGAGKSTILKMIAGVYRPDSGSISVNRLDWKRQPRRYAEQIGYMPDDFQFTAGLTAYETLAFWASLRGLPKSRAKEALVEVGLEDTGKKAVASFSKGMRQRVMFAQALLAKPPLVLMDEPTNGLDPYWMDTFMARVRRLAADGQTVLFSTHQLQMAEALADRVALLRGGRIELEGTADEVREQLGKRGKGLEAAFSEWYSS